MSSAQLQYYFIEGCPLLFLACYNLCMRKKLLIISAVFIFLLHYPAFVFAADEFNTAYDVTYTVDEEGNTKVRQEVTVTNLTDDFYASEHQLNIGSQKISNVWAQDAGGSLEISVSKNEGNTTIRVPFGSPVVGKGKSYTFTLGYDVGAVKKWGNLWRVDIPGISLREETSVYNLRLYVPKKFGEPSFISPNPVKRGEAPEERWFGFEKDQLAVGGVRAGFGQEQIFDFSLQFHLENPLDQKAYIEMPLPPDIAGRQKVIYKDLSPAPQEIHLDEDGNYLARYLLGRKETSAVTFRSSVLVYPEDREKILASSATAASIPEKLKKDYTASLPFWNVDDLEVQKKARQLTSADASVVSNLRSIYDYVVAHLSYDKGRLDGEFERLGAKNALVERENALCTEYADLFISLARAAGIPARLVEGYAHSAKSVETPRVEDALHAWVEVYVPQESSTSHPSRKAKGGTPSLDDSLSGGRRPPEARQSEGWIQIDPTWGSTTGGSDYFSMFDLSHVTFVRKGYSSTEPYLLANYEQEAGDWMEVSFVSTEEEEENTTLEKVIDFAEKGPALLPRSGLIRVRNESGLTAFDVEIFLETLEGTLKIPAGEKAEDFNKGTVVSFGDMPPFSEKEVRFTVSAPKFRKTDGNLTTQVSWNDFEGQERSRITEKSFSFQPFWTYFSSPVGLILFILFAGFIYLLIRVL